MQGFMNFSGKFIYFFLILKKAIILLDSFQFLEQFLFFKLNF